MTRPTLAQLANAQWRASTYSAANNECVEVACSPTWVGVRDTKTPGGPALAVGPSAWAAVVAAVRTEQI
ncbi:DUF397 domain-containing protein [Streptomyces albidoflavus]|uniref:DUF397 domain-containing protein n=1 Tax=Streptomyces albidoflavus TaxID=1886 RepID=UPI0033C7ED34